MNPVLMEKSCSWVRKVVMGKRKVMNERVKIKVTQLCHEC